MPFHSRQLTRRGFFPGLSRPLKLSLLLLATVALLSSCQRGKQAAESSHEKGAMAAKQGAPKAPPANVAVESAHRGSIASYYSSTATLQAQKQAQILARVQGVVKTLNCEEGDKVAADQVLLQLDNNEYLYRLREAEANRAKLESNFDRLKNMVDQHLVSVEEFETAKSDLASARAQEDLARLNVSYTKVTAPFAGSVTQRFIELGQTVSVGTPLFALADFHPLLAKVHVPAREFRNLSVDQPVDLSLDSDDLTLEGHITLISPVIDATTGTIKVTIEIDKFPPNVRPGDFAQVKVRTQRREGNVLVARGAVVSERGEEVVYVAVDSTAERRVVEVGFRDDDNAEILSGVEDGEKVVIKGQGNLKQGQTLHVVEDDGVTLPPPSDGDQAQKRSAS
jgi:RND family efflux transporter MFP subunit